jgi:hypothetical protein
MKNQFSDLKTQLSEQDIDSILQLVGKGCQHKTKARLRSILTYGPSTIEDCGIMRRLTKEPDGSWDYCAGQDYRAEIKAVRNVILGKV